MVSPIRALGRGLRRVLLPLVGYWELRGRLEALAVDLRSLRASTGSPGEGFARLEAALDRLEARFDRLHGSRDELRIGLAELAGGLGEKIDMANEKLEWQRLLTASVAADIVNRSALQAAVTEVIEREIGRLDGYLTYHAAELREEIHAASARLYTQERAYVAPGLDVVIATDGFEVVIPTEETALLVNMLRGGFGRLEPGVRAALRGVIKPGFVVVDAGANIGVHALPMAAAVGPTGRITCFEPLPHVAAALGRSMRVNGFAERATVHAAALADMPGEASFNRAAHSPMSSLFPLAEPEGAHPIPVRLTTLDASLPPGSRVDVVKMDVEGAEPLVWRGMQRVLRDNPVMAIAMEWSGSHFRRSGEDPEAFMHEIRAAGFTGGLIGNMPACGGLTPLPENSSELEAVNVLLTRG